MKYRKKPVVIDAVQWDGYNVQDVINMAEVEPIANTKINIDTSGGRTSPDVPPAFLWDSG